MWIYVAYVYLCVFVSMCLGMCPRARTCVHTRVLYNACGDRQRDQKNAACAQGNTAENFLINLLLSYAERQHLPPVHSNTTSHRLPGDDKTDDDHL